MAWTDDYIGIPFVADGRDRSGCDCWGLVRMVYQNELGIDLPVHSGALANTTAASLRRVAAVAAGEISRRWERVTEPKAFDVALLRRGKINCHVGVVAGPGIMLHVEDGIDAALEHYDGAQWKEKIAGFFRLK